MHEGWIMLWVNLCKDMHECCVMLWANLAGISVKIGCWVLPRLGPLSRSTETMVYI